MSKRREAFINPMHLPEHFWVMEGDEKEVAQELGAYLDQSGPTLRRRPPPNDVEWVLRNTGEGPQTLVTPSGPIKVYRMLLDWIGPHQTGPE